MYKVLERGVHHTYGAWVKLLVKEGDRFPSRGTGSYEPKDPTENYRLMGLKEKHGTHKALHDAAFWTVDDGKFAPMAHNEWGEVSP